MSEEADPIRRASLIVAHDEVNAYDAVVPPIAQTSLFTFSSYDEMNETYMGKKTRPTYTRGLNPTVRHFEDMIARLEGGEDAAAGGTPVGWEGGDPPAVGGAVHSEVGGPSLLSGVPLPAII